MFQKITPVCFEIKCISSDLTIMQLFDQVYSISFHSQFSLLLSTSQIYLQAYLSFSQHHLHQLLRQHTLETPC